MLQPNSNMDLRFSNFHVSALIIKAFKNREMLKFDELLSILIDKTDKKVKEVYLPSLSFLFLLEKIQYHQKIDSFELIG